jgi:hypothetical protein
VGADGAAGLFVPHMAGMTGEEDPGVGLHHLGYKMLHELQVTQYIFICQIK